MTNKADDVFADDDPFEKLEKLLADAIDSDAQSVSEAATEARQTEDVELKLVMDRIRSRTTARTSDRGATASTPDAARTASSSEPSPNESSSVDPEPEAETLVVDTEIASVGFFEREHDGQTRASIDSPAAVRDELESFDRPVSRTERNNVDAGSSSPKITADTPAGKTTPFTDATDLVAARDDAPPQDSAQKLTPSDDEAASIFGALVAESLLTADRKPARRDSASRPAAPRFSPDDRSDSDPPRDELVVGVAIPASSSVPAPPDGTELLALPPSGVTAPVPVAPIGYSPGKWEAPPTPSTVHLRAGPPRAESNSRRSRRSRDIDREGNSRGLLFIAGGITLIVLSVLVYANYFLGAGTDTPVKNMAPAADDAIVDSGADDTAETTSTAAAQPVVEVTGCDREAAHVVVNSQSPTPVIATIRFQFLKDGEIYYEEDSATPRITAGQSLTKSLLLIGKELPAEYADVEPDECKAEVISVVDA